MPVLIDGNNLLYAARAAEALTLLMGRSMLCDALGKWAQRRTETVHVVFDGPPPTAALGVQIGHPSIQVTYSGHGVSADAVLTRLLQADSAARRLTVVSTDHGVARVARRRKARTVRSEDFWAMVKRDLARPPVRRTEPEEKEAGLSPEATQQWLGEFGLDELPGGQRDGFGGA